jgi:hypothetical protein
MDMHERGGYFIYGYLLVAFTMWKWRPPQGRELAMTPDNQIAMRFEPWKARTYNATNVSFNNCFFLQWYNDLINATQCMRIP